ncbi:MAG: hypothetical protein ACHQFZ_03925 [Acidimicrobiales bacterium]
MLLSDWLKFSWFDSGPKYYETVVVEVVEEVVVVGPVVVVAGGEGREPTQIV